MIVWSVVWEKFDKWYESCESSPTWEEQQKKIQRLINAELKKGKAV